MCGRSLDCGTVRLIGVMIFSFARVSAVVGMDVEHYFVQRATPMVSPAGERRQGP